MPLHMVKADLDSGVLVKIHVEAVPRAAVMPMSVVFRKDAPPGPAGRAFIAQLKRKLALRSRPFAVPEGLGPAVLWL
jgi:DNA-binding transcriptional LysR family regulator